MTGESVLEIPDGELFNAHDTYGEHATKEEATLRAFERLLEAEGRPLPVDGNQAYSRYLSGDGIYYRVLGPSGEDYTSRYTILHGVALGRDSQTGVATVEGIYSDPANPRTRAAAYYLWMRKVIPQSTFTRYLDSGFAYGNQMSAISFPEITDRQTQDLLDTFGFDRGETWEIPIPSVTLIGSEETVKDVLASQPPPTNRSVAFVSEGGSGTRVQFFDGGTELGSLTQGNEETLQTVEGETLPIAVPEHHGFELRSLFGEQAVRNQLGFATLKRAAQG